MKKNIFKLWFSSSYCLYSESTIKKKKKGFTIIELIAVMAIMAILAVVITPKIGGYINEAKKTQVVSEMRQIIIAVESYNVKALQANTIEETSKYSDFKTKLIDEGYLETLSNDIVTDTTTFQSMKGVVEGTKKFSIKKDANGKAYVEVADI